jgi:subtilisin-like proprotein convertase family protein
MRKTLLLLLFNFFVLFMFAQNYNISNGSISTCSGNFYDSGGPSGGYGNNQTRIFTICPTTAGDKIRVSFTAFNLEANFDYLEIFDGNSVAAPSLGAYTGTSGPGTVQATPTNASGCLTFRFTSDVITVRPGWAATISCVAPCQNITANFLSSSPAAVTGLVKICQGQSVNFIGSGTFSNSSAGATYLWNFGDGSTATGTSVNHVFNNEGSYQVSLKITDPNGCSNSNSAGVSVQVSTTPNIILTSNVPTICLGESATLSASANAVTFTPNCTPGISGTTFLPDGTGVSYTTSIAVNCYNNGQTVTSVNEINNICLSMEHSYLGDLRMTLICPSGQSVVLHAYPGGNGTYLGCPRDPIAGDATAGPGTARTYCFTPTATTLLLDGATSNCGNPSSASIVAGNYMPAQPLSNLVGCPLNGNWTILVTDNLALDNGYIFSWDVNFIAALTPPQASFTPTHSFKWIFTCFRLDCSQFNNCNCNANCSRSSMLYLPGN